MKFKRFSRLTIFGRRFYFRYVGRNGETIAWGEGYNSAEARDHAIDLVRFGAADAPIEDL